MNETDALFPLRATATVINLCGLFALVIAHLLTPPAAIGTGIVVALASMACSIYPSAQARALRKSFGLGVLVLMLVMLAVQMRDTHQTTHVFGVLALLLIGVSVMQSLGLDTRHDLMVAVTISEFMVVLPAGLKPSSLLAVPMVIAWIGAVVALVQSSRLHPLDCKSPTAPQSRRPAAAQPIAGVVARIAGVVMVIGLLLFLVVPRPKGLTPKGLSRNPMSQGQQSDGSAGRSFAQYSNNSHLDMRARGKLPATPIVDVPADSPRLWRSRIYDRYDGVNWTALDSQITLLGNAGRITFRPDSTDPLESTEPVRVDEVRALEGFDQAVVAPGVPVALTTNAQVGRTSAGRIFVADTRGYVVESVRVRDDSTTLSAATGDDPHNGPWTSLPPGMPPRVAALARDITATTTTRYQAVTAVSDYLARTKRYDLDSRVPPAGADAVDDFLFNAPSGFCEQFAAAEVVLLRTLGIPSRMATGLANQGPAKDGRRILRSSNAHAWVEVYYPGVGWSAADPTPADLTPHDSSADWGKRLMKLIGRLLNSTKARIALAAAIVVAAAAVALWVRLRRRRRTTSAPVGLAVATSALFAAFARLEAALAADGRPRAPAETLAELDRRLGADASGRAALETLERACYSPDLVGADETRAATHAFERLASEILAANAARARLADSIGVPK